jgi:hypothetical protein
MADSVVIAISTMHYSDVGQTMQGELWAADDPLVRAHPDWFTTDLLGNARRSVPPASSVPVVTKQASRQ